MPANSVASETADKADKTILEAEKNVHELAKHAEKVVNEGLEKLRVQSRAYAEEAERTLETAQKYVTERVHERPLTTTLAALGVGMLLGLVLGGRRR
jgi:ElaB/YqjD/DUF883 family membrane-anchored ribosome-binding protein